MRAFGQLCLALFEAVLFAAGIGVIFGGTILGHVMMGHPL